jgi:protein gp37
VFAPKVRIAIADKSTIEWTEATWNPTTGCDRTSPGCDNCYALTLAKRLKAMGQPKYQRDGDPVTSGPGFGLTAHPDALSVPRRWRTGRVVFVNSMSDLFHPDVPDAFILQVFDVMEQTPRHTYQVLTKRSKRLAHLAEHLPWPDNVWMGVSVENQRYAFRTDHLRRVPAAVRFVSIEPLLSPVALDFAGLDWCIVGGESGNGHRSVDPDWVRRIRDDCLSARVAFFFKQWGGARPKSEGRILDGRTWDETPSPTGGRSKQTSSLGKIG